jgi:hypothetical protein
MTPHYSRDKGILSALDYFDHLNQRDNNVRPPDPIPMLRRAKTQGKPIARPSTNRLLALCWLITLLFDHDK